MIVARRGRFYSVATHTSSGERLSQHHLTAALLAVVSAADAAGNVNLSLGPLTGVCRAPCANLTAVARTSGVPHSASFSGARRCAIMLL